MFKLTNTGGGLTVPAGINRADMTLLEQINNLVKPPFVPAPPLQVINTKWCPFVGGPSSGKSTLVKALVRESVLEGNPEDSSSVPAQLKSWSAGACFLPTNEIARSILTRLQDGGLSIESVMKSHFALLQEYFLHWQVIRDLAYIESDPDITKRSLGFDRGWCDASAYLESKKLPWEALRAFGEKIKYPAVFVVEPLALEKDGIRVENESEQRSVHEACGRVYRQCGHCVIDVPAFEDDLNCAKRIRFVTEELRKLKG